ncbi:DUF1206 domain-containing protein [Microbacterium fluvii]|uniref:DUF1206 domain-containing protein n=1 Tax=Microbacterium fluvii TaxID=415215 RepID=A0ABW2HBX4_9MICO|nr:DUF1206 domain-containing protein [Microbacterium fluvii]MCU4671586.1 DUF1206 domain-containing protein [Microbacterium fluvii]
MTAPVKEVAREAARSTPLRALARAGYAANGVVHLLIAAIVLAVAFGGDGESDQSGAFKAIGAAPLGFVVLWVLAIALFALGLWHVVGGVLARGDAKRTWGTRISEWGQAAVFFALGSVAVAVALGAKPDSEQSAEDASRGVLQIPGGVFVLGAVGLGILIAGIAFVVMGVMRSFRKKLTMPSGAAGTALTALGVVGFIAKGIALAIVGVLLLVAAVKVDADTAGGLDGAVQALIGLPYGPVLAASVGIGLGAYGVFCLFRSRYANLDA